MKKQLTLLLALLLAFSLAACAPAAPTAAPTQAPTVAPTVEATAGHAATAPEASLVDFLGEPVTLSAVPETLVSLTPSTTEIVFALGLGARLVGVDSVSDYPDQAKAIQRVGDFNGPNLEAIAALRPGLVLAGNKLQKDAIAKVKGLGIPAAATEATHYGDVYQSIELVGKLTGTEDKAASVIAEMQAKEKAVLDAVAGAQKGKTVYYAMSWGASGNWTAGPGTFPYEFILKSGGKPITENAPVEWINLSTEELVAKDPDIILLAHDVGDLESFTTDEAYQNLKAVKNGSVYVVDANLCSRPGPRMMDGLRQFAQYITGLTIKFPGE